MKRGLNSCEEYYLQKRSNGIHNKGQNTTSILKKPHKKLLVLG
jgi:hypothetical protein